MNHKSIQKRDGRTVPFESGKISAAILKAGLATGELTEEQAKALTLQVLRLVQCMSKNVTVETVQDAVEEVLSHSTFKKTARAYAIYRDQHRAIREIKPLTELANFESYLDQSTWTVRENANMQWSLQGLNNHVAFEITRKYWLERVYSPAVREAHENGDFHIHDLNILAVYCVGWDLMDLLLTGFRGAPGKIETFPAKHLRSALGHMVNFIYTLQGEAAGAQAFSNVDTLLAPFIREDDLSLEQVKQLVQEWVFNCNVPTRVGFQSPFSNISLDITPPEHLKNHPVIVGGEVRDTTYGDYQVEMDMFNRAFLEVMIEGDARGRVFTFPIPTYSITKDFDYNDPKYELLWLVTGKYGVPYFANFVNSDMSPSDARSMCCRMKIDNRELRKRGGGFFGANPLTGSLGVVTINLPRIGHQSRDRQEFLARLDSVLELAKESLIVKMKVLEKFTDAGLYPYSKFYLRAVKERTGSYWFNHFCTIGVIGMEESMINFYGDGVKSLCSRTFALEVMDHIRARLLEFQEETGRPFNLEATPAEGASHRLTKLDRESPEMQNAVAFQDKNLHVYSNSTQPRVDAYTDPYDLLDSQDKFQIKYTGGTVLHIWLGEQVTDPVTVKRFIQNVCTYYELPYFTLSPTFSICPSCGYLAGEQAVCPKCGTEAEVFSRIVGYLRPTKQWNEGKQREFAERTVFTLK